MLTALGGATLAPTRGHVGGMSPGHTACDRTRDAAPILEALREAQGITHGDESALGSRPKAEEER